MFGLASVAITADGTQIVDHQDDIIPTEEIEKAFYAHVEDPGEGDAMHDHKPVSTLIESFVVTPQKLDLLLKALGHTGAPPDFKGVAAWVGYRVHDDATWAKVKAGELGAFSIEGTAEKVEVAA